MLMCNACKKLDNLCWYGQLFNKLLKFINIFAWGSLCVVYLTD